MRLSHAPTLFCISVLSFTVPPSQARSPVRLRHKRQDQGSLSFSDALASVTSDVLSPSIDTTLVPSTLTIPTALPFASSTTSVAFPTPTESSVGPSSATATSTSPQSVPAFTSQVSSQSATSSATSTTTYLSTTTAQSATSPTSTSTGLAPVATQQPAYSGSDGSGGSSGVTVTVSTTVPSSSSSGTGQSSSGFFSNTGAVAGTFTVAGLFGLAGVIGVGMLIAKRRRARSYDDDIEFFDKHDVEPEPHVQSRHTMEDDPTSTEMGHYGDPMAISAPPAAYYPDYGYDATHDPHIQAGYYAQHPYAAQGYGPSHAENLPNPHDFVAVDLSHPHTNTGDIPSVSQLSNHQTSQLAPVGSPTDPRRSVDSFYTGIVDTHGPPGEAL
ncbi:hypothetical protein EDD17DRAFT_1571165 [Pisolithus thermaeus]|nr:hypothetical protein EDD17DRAFT_1571165 [Pisolithus thermaeus]